MRPAGGHEVLGHEVLGSGALAVVVLNDWMCDTSTWDAARAYLDRERWTWVFADLRGYGRSRGRPGAFTVEESAADVLALVRALGRQRCAVVGHSMSSLVALHLAQRHPDVVQCAAVLAPPPPRGQGADEPVLARLVALAHGDDAQRRAALEASWGDRLSRGWGDFKVARWRETSEPAAVAGFAAMFARDGMPDPRTALAVPVLAVTGEQDGEHMRHGAVRAALAPLCPDLTTAAIAEAGHYPMQETPPLLVAHVERFLAGRGAGTAPVQPRAV